MPELLEDPYAGEDEMDRTLPEFNGPYKEGNGFCAWDHPLNGHGRCEALNKIPRECPPKNAE